MYFNVLFKLIQFLDEPVIFELRSVDEVSESRLPPLNNDLLATISLLSCCQALARGVSRGRILGHYITIIQMGTFAITAYGYAE
ncbi:hypothetical protein AVEN_189996-1 [Araneus ventricosus]|uniref:Uncharacterized protein n=1 Tax=Araneus ventricosus TaxID=182803 RepID=A0A4Y2U0Q1_ARAVE|nr:hypothetical protein AVEN_189996-1 [Araneus ventricosus]